jgi:hypothetical protein
MKVDESGLLPRKLEKRMPIGEKLQILNLGGGILF